MKDVWGDLSVDRILINVTKLLFIFFNFSPAPSPFSFFFFVSCQGLALLPRLDIYRLTQPSCLRLWVWDYGPSLPHLAQCCFFLGVGLGHWSV